MMEFYLEQQPWYSGIDMHMRVFQDGKMSVAEAVTMRTLGPEENGIYLQPLLQIHQDAAQGLMDELWKCGIRPSEGTGSAGQLKATQNHLADMQEIVGHLLDLQPREITREIK